MVVLPHTATRDDEDVIRVGRWATSAYDVRLLPRLGLESTNRPGGPVADSSVTSAELR